MLKQNDLRCTSYLGCRPNRTAPRAKNCPLQYKGAKENGRRGGEEEGRGKSPGPEGKRKGRHEKPPGKRKRQRTKRENRARERDVIILLQPAGTSQPRADWWHEAHCKMVTEKKRQCTIKGASGPLLGK